MPRRGKSVDQLVMSCAVDGELGLVLCFGILLLLLRFEIGSLKVPETSIHSISDCHRAVRYAVMC